MSRIESRLLNHVATAGAQFQLFDPGDVVMVCLSGGKDSYALMRLLDLSRRHSPVEFTLIAVNLDQGHPGFDQGILRDWCVANRYAHHMVHRDTFSIVKEKVPEGKTYCSLCSRLRRGVLYQVAQELGATKVALGHHRDDVIETLMLNLLYAGQIKAMPPRLVSDDGRNVVIRPLVTCSEADLAEYAAEQAFPILPCDLCGSQDNLKRKRVKRLLTELQAENNNVKGNLFAALSNIQPSHVLDPAVRAAFGIDANTRGDPELNL